MHSDVLHLQSSLLYSQVEHHYVARHKSTITFCISCLPHVCILECMQKFTSQTTETRLSIDICIHMYKCTHSTMWFCVLCTAKQLIDIYILILCIAPVTVQSTHPHYNAICRLLFDSLNDNYIWFPTLWWQTQASVLNTKPDELILVYCRLAITKLNTHLSLRRNLV